MFQVRHPRLSSTRRRYCSQHTFCSGLKSKLTGRPTLLVSCGYIAAYCTCQHGQGLRPTIVAALESPEVFWFGISPVYLSKGRYPPRPNLLAYHMIWCSSIPRSQPCLFINHTYVSQVKVRSQAIGRIFLFHQPHVYYLLRVRPLTSTMNVESQVICRIRPPTADEKASGVPMALEALGEGEVGVKTSGRHGGGGGGASSWRSFALDKALGPSTTQEEVFRQVRGGSLLCSRHFFLFFLIVLGVVSGGGGTLTVYL